MSRRPYLYDIHSFLPPPFLSWQSRPRLLGKVGARSFAPKTLSVRCACFVILEAAQKTSGREWIRVTVLFLLLMAHHAASVGEVTHPTPPKNYFLGRERVGGDGGDAYGPVRAEKERVARGFFLVLIKRVKMEVSKRRRTTSLAVEALYLNTTSAAPHVALPAEVAAFLVGGGATSAAAPLADGVPQQAQPAPAASALHASSMAGPHPAGAAHASEHTQRIKSACLRRPDRLLSCFFFVHDPFDMWPSRFSLVFSLIPGSCITVRAPTTTLSPSRFHVQCRWASCSCSRAGPVGALFGRT
jgi:hypothetical protein